MPEGGRVRFVLNETVSDVDGMTKEALLTGAMRRTAGRDSKTASWCCCIDHTQRGQTHRQRVPSRCRRIETFSRPPQSARTRGGSSRFADLVRRFGNFTAVDHVSFEVRRGEIFGLLGPNGAGKTTTFRMLCGLLPATSGTLRVAGVDLRHARASARQRIGYVAQKFSLYGQFP